MVLVHFSLNIIASAPLVLLFSCSLCPDPHSFDILNPELESYIFVAQCYILSLVIFIQVFFKEFWILIQICMVLYHLYLFLSSIFLFSH